MALNLTVPALDDKPLINAETRPQKILEFLSKLPPAPLDAASTLREELEILNRQRVSADHRFRALDIYREHSSNIVRNLAHSYCTSSLPLSREAKAYAAAAESLWLELAYGYKLTLNDQLGQLFSANSKTVALTIHRAMEALQQLSMVYYETYFPVPGTVWSDLHQLYFHAAQQSLLDLDVSSGHKSSTINLIYKEILLMALADPQHLSPQDIELVADYIARYAKHTQIQGLGALENPAGIFIISLDSSQPPVPYVKNIKETNSNTDIFFITVELARLVHQHLQIIQSGNIPKSAGLPDSLMDARYQDMLVYLIKHWGVSPKRIYKRSSKNNISQLGIGLLAAHYFINNEQHYVQPSSEEQVIAQNHFVAKDMTQSKPAPKASNWQVLNISAGGTALRKFPTVDAHVRIGELLCTKNEGDKAWSVAVLRWANNGLQDQLDIGTQLIAPSARAAGIRVLDGDQFEPSLVLPEMPAIKQAASIISRTGMYAPARVLELDMDGHISKVMITKLVERTRSFERFQFSTL